MSDKAPSNNTDISQKVNDLKSLLESRPSFDPFGGAYHDIGFSNEEVKKIEELLDSIVNTDEEAFSNIEDGIKNIAANIFRIALGVPQIELEKIISIVRKLYIPLNKALVSYTKLFVIRLSKEYHLLSSKSKKFLIEQIENDNELRRLFLYRFIDYFYLVRNKKDNRQIITNCINILETFYKKQQDLYPYFFENAINPVVSKITDLPWSKIDNINTESLVSDIDRLFFVFDILAKYEDTSINELYNDFLLYVKNDSEFRFYTDNEIELIKILLIELTSRNHSSETFIKGILPKLLDKSYVKEFFVFYSVIKDKIEPRDLVILKPYIISVINSLYNDLSPINRGDYAYIIIKLIEIGRLTKEEIKQLRVNRHLVIYSVLLNPNIFREILKSHAGSIPSDDLSVLNYALNFLVQPKISKYELFAIENGFVFGKNGKEIFEEIARLDKEVGPMMKKIGITASPGPQALQQLERIVYTLKQKAAMHNPELNYNFDSDFDRIVFIGYTGFYHKDSNYTGNESDLIKKVENTRRLRQESPWLFENPFLLVSEYEVIAKSKNNKAQEGNYTQDFIEKWSALTGELKAAADLVKANDSTRKLKGVISEIATEFNKEIDKLYEELLRKKKELADNPLALSQIQKTIEDLKSLNLKSIRNFPRNIRILKRFGKLHSRIRTALFAFGLLKHPNQIEIVSRIQKEKPSQDDILTVAEFVEHLVYHETFEDFLKKDKQARRAVKDILGIKALTEQVNRIEKLSKSEKTTSKITFSTHRDLHTEISGEVGNACWMGHEILKEYPNFYSILIRKNVGSKKEKVIGSSLLIRTKDKDGGELLIIRGLNPRQNEISRLDVESFFWAVVDYVHEIAKQIDAKVAISIDDHSGGHTTNRPLLFEYISSLRSRLENAQLFNPKEAVFNGYDIKNDVYLIPRRQGQLN